MFNLKLHLLIALPALFCSLESSAQELSLSLGGYKGKLLEKGPSQQELVRENGVQSFEASFAWKASGDSVSAYDEIWGRPTIESGVVVSDFHRVGLRWETAPWAGQLDYKSGMGVVITPFVAFCRPLLRTEKVELGYKMGNGLGISTRPYNRDTNAENELIGNWLSVFVDLGLYAKYNLTDNLQLGAEANFRHYSNGKLAHPNLGANTAEVGMKLTYRISPDTIRRATYSHGMLSGWRKHLYADLNVCWCPQTLLQDYSFDWLNAPSERQMSYRMYHAFGLSAALMWSYNMKYSSGIGIDYVNIPFVDDMAASEKRNGQVADYELSPHVLGLSLRHEARYKNFSLYLSLGYYLQKRLGVTADDNQKRYYETAGVRWYLPFMNRRSYVGYSIQACSTKANFFQFSVGFCPFL